MSLSQQLARNQAEVDGTGSSSRMRDEHDTAAASYTRRSAPIAIPGARPRSQSSSSDSDSDNEDGNDAKRRGEGGDDEDANIVDVERDAVRLGILDPSVLSQRRQQQQRSNASTSNANLSHSLPSRFLLRAPRLGSVPTNSDYESYRQIPVTSLPPPLSLHDDASLLDASSSRGGMSYGSLRESNVQGKFWDGPQSYRDGRTGELRSVGQTARVRFAEHASSETPALSIGERMQRTLERQQEKRKATRLASSVPKASTSSLSALLMQQEEATQTSNSSAAAPAHCLLSSTNPLLSQQNTMLGTQQTSNPFYAIPATNHHHSLPTGALSSSLTGLEILQRGLRLTTITDHDSSSDDAATGPPRDAQGNNALLSRSLSDPRGTGRRLAETQQRSPLLPTYPTHHQPITSLEGFFMPPAAAANAGQGLDVSNPPSHHNGASSASSWQPHGMAPNSTRHHQDNNNDDTEMEGVFEMDME